MVSDDTIKNSISVTFETPNTVLEVFKEGLNDRQDNARQAQYLFDEVKRVIAENNLDACNYLIDMRLIGSVHYISPEAMEIYSKKLPSETKMNKAAIVGKSLILETTVNLVMQAVGRSQSFKWFNDFEEAKKWLMMNQ